MFEVLEAFQRGKQPESFAAHLEIKSGIGREVCTVPNDMPSAVVLLVELEKLVCQFLCPRLFYLYLSVFRSGRTICSVEKAVVFVLGVGIDWILNVVLRERIFYAVLIFETGTFSSDSPASGSSEALAQCFNCSPSFLAELLNDLKLLRTGQNMPYRAGSAHHFVAADVPVANLGFCFKRGLT